MIKKTFVWLFMLVFPLLATVVSQTGTTVAACAHNDQEKVFSSVSDLIVHEICEESDLVPGPIVKADEFEWRENLSDLLRHRVSSYRFAFLECGVSCYFHFPQKQTLVRSGAVLNRIARKILTLPDYYCFLHRLCPF